MTDRDPGREPLWRAGRAEDLVWADLGEDHVVYHRPSGKTHFLNSASVALLKDVLPRPTTARAAADELAAREDAVPGDEFYSAVQESLAQLEYLGLASRVDD